MFDDNRFILFMRLVFDFLVVNSIKKKEREKEEERRRKKKKEERNRKKEEKRQNDFFRLSASGWTELNREIKSNVRG